MTGRETRHLPLVINSSNTSAIKVKRWGTPVLFHMLEVAQSKGHEIHSIPRNFFTISFPEKWPRKIDIYISALCGRCMFVFRNNVLSTCRGIDSHDFHPWQKEN